MMKVINALSVYEVDGVEPKDGSLPRLKIESHWNRNEFVVIEMLNGTKCSVVAEDLERAIRNARNWR